MTTEKKREIEMWRQGNRKKWIFSSLLVSALLCLPIHHRAATVSSLVSSSKSPLTPLLQRGGAECVLYERGESGAFLTPFYENGELKSPLILLCRGRELGCSSFSYKGKRNPNVSSLDASTQHPASSIQHPASRTGFVYHDIYLQHKTGANHPERPQRLTVIVTRLREKGLLSQLVTPAALPDPSEWLVTIHTPQYVERVRRSYQEGVRYMDSIDTPVSPESYKVAVAAVGGVLSAIDEVMAGKIRNAFCAIRPPGHHALKDGARGFCIFNNVAIGARYIQKKHNLPKILIVDWDVHHGNGTQAAFYDDPTVLYFSTHQYPFYPGTGSEEERGTGKGFGCNINVPLPAGCGDEEYRKVFEEILKPKAIEFDPDFVLISAGFDAHKDDPIGGMNVTAKGFAEMTSIVKEIAEKCCEGRIVSVLEGGYNLDGLADSVEAHISALQE